MAVHDAETFLLLGNLIGYGIGLRFNARPLRFQDFDLTSIGFCKPQKRVILGRINQIEINVANVEPDKQGHDKIFSSIPLGFKARFTHEQTYLIRLKLAHALLGGYEV